MQETDLFNPAGAPLDWASWDLDSLLQKRSASEPNQHVQPAGADETRLARSAGSRVEVEEGQRCLQRSVREGWGVSRKAGLVREESACACVCARAGAFEGEKGKVKSSRRDVGGCGCNISGVAARCKTKSRHVCVCRGPFPPPLFSRHTGTVGVVGVY